PGEVICRISGYSLTIIIWRGKLDADSSYIATPTGAAKYYDGNPHNLHNTVLSAYGAKILSAPLSSRARNRNVKPIWCIPLNLVDSTDIDHRYLLTTGFIRINEIPPIVFRYEEHVFTRVHDATRFDSQRPRPDGPANASTMSNNNQYTATTVPFMQSNVSNTINTNNPMLSMASHTKLLCANSPSSMYPYANFSFEAKTGSVNNVVPWNSVAPEDEAELVQAISRIQ
uniref:PARP catalytic domain-containing protein n=1 Tax=Elaeophora elaphi TaxID=1147741 RepID=A0A0R3S588_9BILA